MADKKISALNSATTPLGGTEVLPIVQGGSTVKVAVSNLTAGRDISTTGITVSSNTGNIELNWASGSTHKVGSTFSTSYFTGMRVDADSRNTDIVSFDASGSGNVRLRTGVIETTRLNVDPTGNVTVNTGNLVVGTAGKGIDFSANAHAAGMTSELLNDYEEGTWTPSVSATSGAITTVGTVVGRYTKIGRQVTIHYQVAITNNGTGGGFLTIQGLPFTPTTALSQFNGIGSNASSAKSTVSTIDGGVIYVRYYDATYPVASGEIVFGTITYEV